MSGDLLPRAGGRLMVAALPQKAAPRALLTLAVLLVCRGFHAKEQEGLILGFLSGSLDQRFRCDSCESTSLPPTRTIAAAMITDFI